MQRFCHRAGVGIVAWRQSGTADVTATLAQRDNHRRIVTRGRHGRVVVGYAVAGTTITCTVGNAVADGVVAAISTSGTTAITATPGAAVADGLQAAIIRIIVANPGGAVASGAIAALLRSIAASPGAAVANGVTATVTSAAVVDTFIGPGRARIGTTVLHKAHHNATFKAPSKRIGAPTL